MSKIGGKPIKLPETVSLTVNGSQLMVKGREGEIRIDLPAVLTVKKEGEEIRVGSKKTDKKAVSLQGLYRQLIHNAVVGVEKPWEKKLEIVGTGYNGKMQGEDLLLKLGYSHQVVFKKEIGVKYRMEGNNLIVVSGTDKQLVGQVAYQIKILKKPDAYKGKGIRYQGEIIKLKPSKKVKATEAGG